jgi:hypothetical protein
MLLTHITAYDFSYSYAPFHLALHMQLPRIYSIVLAGKLKDVCRCFLLKVSYRWLSTLALGLIMGFTFAFALNPTFCCKSYSRTSIHVLNWSKMVVLIVKRCVFADIAHLFSGLVVLAEF